MSAPPPSVVEAFAARTFVDESGHALPYRLLLPAGDAGPSPLLLVLHGAGERGTDNVAQLGNGIGSLLLESRAAFPCVAVVPQCAEGHRWVEVDWGAASHPLPAALSLPLHAALALVQALLAEAEVAGVPIDPARLYLMGLSMGGYGVWDAVCRQPQRFAAAVPICGGAPEEPEHARALCAAGLPIWAFHGALDLVVPVERSRRIMAALGACAGLSQSPSPVRYTEYADVGHDAWTTALREPELLPWLFAQRSRRRHNESY